MNLILKISVDRFGLREGTTSSGPDRKGCFQSLDS